HVCYVDQITLSRSDPAKEEEEIRELIRTTLSETIHVEEARRSAARLRAFADDAARNPDLRRQAKSCADNLARQIERAQEYGSQQDQILAAVGQQQSVTVLVRCLGQLKELPILEHVKEEDWEPADGLRQKLVEAIGELVRRKCRDYAGIRRVEDYTQRQTALRTLKKQVQEVADPSLTSEVDTALEELDRGLQELRARQDDDRLVAQAQAMDPSAPLAKLDANVVMLKAMSPKSQAARDIIAAKQAELAESARNARLWVQTVTDRLAAIDTVDGARNLRDAILRRQDLYADTPERNRLDDAASKCELIADTLERADEIAASKFGSPSELERALERIRELRDTNARKLESAQVARLDDARAALERRRDDLSERARKWLDDCERDLKVGTDPGKLLEKLDRPHPFLPATEVARVSRLREAAVALRDKAERERQERERKRRELDEAEKHDRMLISEAHRMSSNGTLSALRSDLNRLQEMRPRTERGNAEIDRRRKDLADAIAKVEHGLRSACARLDSIDASQKAHQLEIELSRMLALCSGCPEHEDIEGCAKRCERVKRYLTAIEEIRSSRLQAPADADYLLGRISAALTEAGDVLSDIQRSVARSAEDEIRTRVEKSSLQARQWLEDLETREAQGADPVDLQRLLAKVPAFLPSEDATRLEALRQRVQDRIDADEVASVLERFCRIQSRAKREECLQRLQVLLSQENLA
ncbi:MAG: hypothetical protein GX446_17080, partial [Chthonomonadales bacterium]|nr:hypothetical protein [Chthonomonadales bacterium]